MIYLKAEKRAFEAVKERFGEAYIELLSKMHHTVAAKGEVRDTESPIHHRISPAGQLALAQAKCRRIEALLTKEGFATSHNLLDKTIEECTDAANYLLFIASLCTLLQAEVEA